MGHPNKYPSTPHWINSPTVHRNDSYTNHPEQFLNKRIVITEKLDGGNTCLFNGQVYARSVIQPSNDGWMAMVKKHHAWKSNYPYVKDMAFYGEDIYGIHSIEYNAVKESETFYLFAIRKDDFFLNWKEVRDHTDFPVIPEVFDGIFFETKHLTNFLKREITKPSALGGPREGFVIRNFKEFYHSDFDRNVCKYVRKNHVQTDQHWRKQWRKALIKM